MTWQTRHWQKNIIVTKAIHIIIKIGEWWFFAIYQVDYWILMVVCISIFISPLYVLTLLSNYPDFCCSAKAKQTEKYGEPLLWVWPRYVFSIPFVIGWLSLVLPCEQRWRWTFYWSVMIHHKWLCEDLNWYLKCHRAITLRFRTTNCQVARYATSLNLTTLWGRNRGSVSLTSDSCCLKRGLNWGSMQSGIP